ncbi:hypothetical protein BLA29_007629 [Euroglyphus maynei]|uniref:acid phosphatase n=1 Tax=Euroglyphus maynei TaxID=6958 RepID=A0A1Y3AR14_EURMA|nr:hypothetical protein BLA29_007629 [Euroglyphus maynei]
MFGHRLIIIIAICAIITFESTISSVIHQPQTDHHDELKLVFLFHRHGERTPYLLYPNDPYKKIITETVGIGQLIEKGKQRLYRLGEYLSQRYYNDNGDRFSIKQKSPRKVYARSSGSERCLQSITLLLAGMFPPEGEWKWNDNLGSLWQPFAIQTVPFEHDTLLNPDYGCPVADHLSNEIYNSEEAENISQNYRNLFKKLANYTGYPSDEMDIVKASYIYDIILSESNFDLPPPEWLDDEMWNGMKILNDYVFSFNSSSRRIQRFRCGL